MIDSPREARCCPPVFWTAVRACLLLLLAVAPFAPRIAAQALNPGGPVDFGTYPVNAGSNTLTLVFNASTPTNISSVTTTTAGAANSDFTVAFQDCTGMQAPPASCIISLTFAPTTIGLRRGALMIVDSTGSIVNLVFLHGIGLAPQIVLAPAAAAPVDLGVAGLSPTSSVRDGNGSLFFTDVNSNSIYERTTAGANSTLGSVTLTSNSQLAVSGQGYVYVSSPGSAKVYAINPAAATPTPTPVSTGSVTLVRPTGLAVDGLGYLYIADSGSNSIVRVNLDGSGTVALTLSGLSTPLSNPTGLAVDENNFLYIADTGNNRIVKASLLTGKATVLSTGALTLSSPQGVTVDPAGSVTVADTGNTRLVELPAAASPFLLATPGATLSSPVGLMTELNGDIMVADSTAGMVLVSRSKLSLKFATPTKVGTTDAVDPDVIATFQNSGNVPIQLTVPGSGTNPNSSTGAFGVDANSSTCPVVQTGAGASSANQIALGAICTYASTFSPTNTGLNTAQLVLAASALAGSPSLSQSVTLTGTGFSTLDHFTVVASPTPVTPGAPVTLTVTAITNTGAVATDYLGTITFTATDSTAVFPAGLTYTFTAADAGIHTFTAPPAGVRFNTLGTFTVSVADNIYVGTSNPVQVVNPVSVVLASSVNPVYVNGSTVLSVSVGAAVGNPTGTVTFYNGTTSLGSATLTSGAAGITVPFSTPGTYTLTAVYSGDANFPATTSNAIVETVQLATASVALTSSVNPLFTGGTTVLSAAVATPTGTATGTISFYNGTSAIGTAPLVNGSAILKVPFTTPGTYTLTAVYSGDATFPTATSNVVTETVQNASATITLASSINPVLLGNNTVLSVLVNSTSATPTGSVTFLDGATVLGTANLVSGGASLSATFATTGNHTLTVSYSGDALFNPGTSNIVTEVAEDFTIAVAPNASASATTNPGSPASFTLLVSPVGASTLAGPVAYKLAGTPTGATVISAPTGIPAGAGPTQISLTITPSATRVARLEKPSARPGSRSYAPIAFAALLAPLAFFRRRSRLAVSLCLGLFLTVASLGLTGCLSDSNSGYYAPQPQTYPLTVTATSGSLTHSVSLSLTVE